MNKIKIAFHKILVKNIKNPFLESLIIKNPDEPSISKQSSSAKRKFSIDLYKLENFQYPK